MARLAVLPLCVLLLFILGSLASLLGELDWDAATRALWDEEVRFALLMSLGMALVSLLLSALIALPAAWFMARARFPGRKALDLALDLPMVTPPLVAGMGLLFLLGQNGPVGALLPAVARNLFSPLGVVIAQTYVACSILMRSAVSAFISIDYNYVHAAHTLGLSPLNAFLLVEIPLCWRPLLGGCILAVSRSLGEFGATLMLAGAIRMKTETLPMAVYLNIATGDFKKAIACAALLLIIAAILLLALHCVQKPIFRRADAP